jgi:hypothetical protein
MGFPYKRYSGSSATGITLRADPDRRGTQVFHWVAVRCGSNRGGGPLAAGAGRRGAPSQRNAPPRPSASRPPAWPRAPRRSAAGGLWFGQLVALVDTAASHAARAEDGSNLWAFVRWLENAPETRASRLLRLTRLRWCDHSRRLGGRREVVPYYDLVQLAAIAGPVCIVPDESPAASEGHFFYNHFVR